MSYPGPALEAVDQVRQLNRVFLSFLRERPRIAVEHFGLGLPATELLRRSTLDDIDRAADFPRALFGFRLPEPKAEGPVAEGPFSSGPGFALEPECLVLQVTLLQSAFNLCRTSGYSARLLLGLGDDDVLRLRSADVAGILRLARAEHVVHAAFDRLDWIWRELLTEARPERRRRLWLLALQPAGQ